MDSALLVFACLFSSSLARRLFSALSKQSRKMADSLDDFFAKKDKKKKEKKTTGKFTVAEDVSKNSEEPSKTAIEKPKKNVEKNNVNASGFVSKNHDQVCAFTFIIVVVYVLGC